MSNIISTKNIIDRKHETTYVVNDINQNDGKPINKVLFLWSDSGLGKTSIVEKASQDRNLKKPIIIIETPPINNNELIENGDYISYIAESISSYFKNQKWSLKDFLMLGLSERLAKSENAKIVSNLTNLPLTVFSTLCERVLSLNHADTDKILNSVDLDSVLINSEYIKATLETFSFVLDISNMQNADSMSIMQLQKILSTTTGQYFIFEYTTKDKNTDYLWKMVRVFDKIADIDVYEINELPIEYALTIVNPDNYNIIDELESFYKQIAKGNLYKLSKLKKELDGTISLKTLKDPLKLKIESLNYPQKLLLSIICLHDGYIKKETLNEILEFISNEYYISPKDILNLDEFIEIKKQSYKLQHASIIDSLEIGFENFASVAAYKFLKEYYSSKNALEFQKGKQKNNYTFQLLKLYSIFEPIMILQKLKEFKSLIISCISEMQGRQLLNKIFFSIKNDMNESVKLHIVNLCYEVGFYKTAYYLLKEINLNGENRNILECMLLNRTDRHIENIDKCERLLKEKNHNNRFILIINMIKMLSERSLNNVKAYHKTFKKIFKSRNFINLYEYGFLLRNSQIIFSYKESLEYIKQSIDFFNLRDSPKDAACSELTYAVQLARLGHLDEANLHLNKIKDTLLDSTFEKHIVYVNQSAIAMLNGSSDEQTLLLLEKSILSATTSFDKVVILNNKLCWYIINNVDERLFVDLKFQLDKFLLTEPDSRLHRRTYINYSKYYKYVMKNPILASAWLKKAMEIPSNNDELGDIYISGTCKNPELFFLAKQHFYVSFITYWHFDLPIN